MLEEKKSEKVNLENRRLEIFLVAVVIILSFMITALEWDSRVRENDKDEALDDLIENIDFNKLKKDQDMVAAISETDKPAETSNVKPAELITQQQLTAPTTSKLIVGDGQSETPEAKVEEVRPQTIETKEDLPEGFQVVEQLPEFPGGAIAFMKWITSKVRYPKFAQDGKIRGRVVVSFLVDTEGNVQRLRLEKSTNRALGVEVIKAMGDMPKWKPGKQNGKPCTAMIAVPINFEL